MGNKIMYMTKNKALPAVQTEYSVSVSQNICCIKCSSTSCCSLGVITHNLVRMQRKCFCFLTVFSGHMLCNSRSPVRYQLCVSVEASLFQLKPIQQGAGMTEKAAYSHFFFFLKNCSIFHFCYFTYNTFYI